MQKGVNKTKFMKSLGNKWNAQRGVKKKVTPIVGSLNKQPQIKYLGKVFEGMSMNQAKREMLKMGLSPIERKKFIEDNEELSRVFGVKKDGDKPLTEQEKRKLQKKEEIHKKYNIKSSREGMSSEILDGKKNRIAGARNTERKSDITVKLHSDEDDHNVAALGGSKGSASITKAGPDSVVGESGATGLTGGTTRGISKAGRPGTL